MQADSDASCTIIKVNMSDAYASSTMLKAYTGTRASELCAVIAHKLALTQAEIPLHHLILVFTVIGWTGRRHHTIKTLTADENVLTVLAEVTRKQNEKHNNLEGKLDTFSTWHYKDSLSHPLDADFDPDDDASGNSTSDEEEEISLSDVSYLRQNDRKGFMLKKSSKDPNLWRRRYCILTDKLWCIDAKRSVPRATSIDIFNNITLASNHTVEIPYSFALVKKQKRGPAAPSSSAGSHQPQQRGLRDFYFRVQSEVSMASWMDELRQRIVLNRENQVMVLAEQIICDEEKSRYKKISKAIEPFTSNYSIFCDPLYAGGVRDTPASSAPSSSRTSRVNSSATATLVQSFRDSPALPEVGGVMISAPPIGSPPPPSVGNAGGLPEAVAPVSMSMRARSATLARAPDSFRSQATSHDNGDGGHNGVCVFGSSRITKNVASRLHKFHKHNTIEADILGFVLAVCRFKEICRHDLQYSVVQKWERACQIYNEFIVYQLLFNTHELAIASVGSGGSTPGTRDSAFEGFPLEKKAVTVGSPGGPNRTLSGPPSLIWQLGGGDGTLSGSVLFICLMNILSHFKTVTAADTGSGRQSPLRGSGRTSPGKPVSKTFRYRREDINAVIPVVNPYSAVPSASESTATAAPSGSYWLWPSSPTPTTPTAVKKKVAPPLPTRPAAVDENAVSAAATLDVNKVPECLSVSGPGATHSLLDETRSPPGSLFDAIVDELKLNKMVNVSYIG